MAARMLSSALTETIILNERFAHDLLRHNIQRNIQQRRKTRGIFYRGFRVYLTPCQKERTRTCISFLGLDCCWSPSGPGQARLHLHCRPAGKYGSRVYPDNMATMLRARGVWRVGVRHSSREHPEHSRVCPPLPLTVLYNIYCHWFIFGSSLYRLGVVK